MRIALRSAVVALLVTSVVSACYEENPPTGPSSDDPALAETTSGCGPASSEFVRSYEGETETLEISFEIESDETSCRLDMSSEGIVFGDTIFDEEWVMHQQYAYVQNLPSPERFAITLGTYQGTIIFDQPIRSLSFYYNTAEDGLRVTTYNQYGWIIQSDSLQPTSNGDEWKHYSVSVSGGTDQIERVFLDYWDGNTGAFRLDDMEITRGAPPAVACDTVARGETATCTITRPVDSVLSWTFTGPLEHWLFSPDTVTVTDSTSSTTWTGRAVLPGDVSATATMNGGVDTVTLQGTLPVDDRPWAWGQADWTWTDLSTTSLCGYQGDEWYLPYAPGDATTLAHNRWVADCDVDGRLLQSIQPSWPDSAYVRDRVQGGPNADLWYVTSADFFMDRTADMNPFLKQNYTPRDQVTDKTDVRLCSKWAGTTLVNFWEYNELCQRFSLDPFFRGLWDHEGMGSNATTTDYQLANGHEARRWIAARDTANDPMRIVEDIVHPDSGHFGALIENGLDGADDSINAVSGDHNYVNDSYLQNNGKCGRIFVLDTAQMVFQDTTISHQPAPGGPIYCM